MPELWYPLGYGEQPLYTLAVYCGGELLYSERFGITLKTATFSAEQKLLKTTVANQTHVAEFSTLFFPLQYF